MDRIPFSVKTTPKPELRFEERISRSPREHELQSDRNNVLPKKEIGISIPDFNDSDRQTFEFNAMNPWRALGRTGTPM
jgi:hypothetical protein